MSNANGAIPIFPDHASPGRHGSARTNPQQQSGTPPTLQDHPIPITEQLWPEGTTPIVSIFCISYNHEYFIRQAIEGFLIQKTTFPVEIFIHDDASTDKTQEIILEYVDKHPTLFRTILQTENQHSKNGGIHFFDLIALQRGKFIAVCEGDDFWTYPFKLQRQVDILKRTGAVMCLHACHVLSGVSESLIECPPLSKDRYHDPMDLANDLGHFPTASVMFDKQVIPEIPHEYFTLYCADTPLWMLLAARGEVRAIPERWSVYRVHPQGIWSGLQDAEKIENAVKTMKVIAEVLGREFDVRSGQWRGFFQGRAKDLVRQGIINCVSSGKWRAARRGVWEYLWGLPYPRLVPPRHQWGLYLRILLGIPSSLMKKYEEDNPPPTKAS